MRINSEAVIIACFTWALSMGASAETVVGVTLHPYFSWTKNIVAGTDVQVRAILPGEVDAGSYQPSPEDIRKLADIDAIVVNGLGHDDFIFDMIMASGNKGVLFIRPNDGAPLIAGARGGSANSHTFISFTNAIQQSYTIARELATIAPEHSERFRANAREYARRLRKIKGEAAQELVAPKTHRVVTVHDGYSYLLQEFGIELAGVVEPAHGLVPSAAELQSVIDLLRGEDVRVIYTEERFPDALLRVLDDASAARVYRLSHIATGEYTAEKFETEMHENARVLVRSLAAAR
ncbi:MAG: ABC transporter substrate-binding protein [Gemmatimonadetes bacterium]|nr:ABC transporter substrate-binding protein [Gemmatimonadota bacterium]